jgi:hypothetical protein
VVLMLMSADSQKQEVAQAARLALMESRIDELATKQNNSVFAILNMFCYTLRNLVQVELKCFLSYFNVLYSEGKRVHFKTGTETFIVLFFCLVFLLITCHSIRKSRQKQRLGVEEERRRDENQNGGIQNEGAIQISQHLYNGKKRMKWKIRGKVKHNGERIPQIQ